VIKTADHVIDLGPDGATFSNDLFAVFEHRSLGVHHRLCPSMQPSRPARLMTLPLRVDNDLAAALTSRATVLFI
jgi:hypothetical protein